MRLRQITKPASVFFILLIGFSTLLTGCYSAKIVAPADSNIKLADKVETLPVKTEKKNWYILWGLVPLNDTSTNHTIEEYKLTKVRAETKVTPLDFVINIFTSIVSVYTTTTEIQGERASTADATTGAPQQ